MPAVAQAGLIHAFSDTLSDSAATQSADHQLDFIPRVSIPANGYIRFVPQSGAFSIPSTNFDTDNVELYVATSSGYVRRSATSTVGTSTDGISITSGTSGSIEITLNSSTGIPKDADVRMVIGTDTANATTTDVGIMNPSSPGTYEIEVEVGGGATERGKTLVAITDPVTVGPVDTTETIPPVRFNGAPTGTLSGTTDVVEMSLETDEFALCRYSTASGTSYFSMGNEFDQNFNLVHAVEIDVATNTSYTFFVRCIDDEGNANSTDFEISFTVPEFPEGEPGEDGDEEGEGSGTGEGEGDSDAGSGDPSGGDDTSGGTSGGGGGGGSGGGSGSSSGGDDGSGGFEGTDAPYQSGDAQVIINGYAFPNSNVIALVDGARAAQTTASTDGKFSITLNEIARGTYTFGVYAIDENDVKSTTYSTTFSVTGGRGSTLSNVNIMPSILVSPDPVDPGDAVNFTGFTLPDATVTVENENDRTSASRKTFTATSDSSGEWTLDVDTAGFQTGTYKVRARAENDSGVSTDFSDYTYYGVGEQAESPRTSDLNQDGFVNLTDFSMLLFWWETDGGDSNPSADINGDGTVNLTDFSIMIFNWTG